MRRGVGIGAIKKKELQQTKFEKTANDLNENEMTQMTKQFETFKEKLQAFAVKYKDEIKHDAQFRKQFQDMCANIGVDPLASSKGFWSEVLGVGDFYYELAVQIIEICNSMQDRTGGLIYLDVVLSKIRKVRSRFVNEVSLDDCRRAIKKLSIFGSAFTLIAMNNGRFMIQSVPDEMSVDHTQVIKLAESNNGMVTSSLIGNELKWDQLRVENSLNFIIKEGIAWLDIHQEGVRLVQTYYFPSLFMTIQV